MKSYYDHYILQKDLESRFNRKTLEQQLDILRGFMYDDLSYDEYGNLAVYEELGFKVLYGLIKKRLKERSPLTWPFEKYQTLMNTKSMEALKMFYELNDGFENEII